MNWRDDEGIDKARIEISRTQVNLNDAYEDARLSEVAPAELEAARAIENYRDAVARAVLEALFCANNWEDSRDCTFADVSLDDACDRCTMLAELEPASE